MSSPPGPPPSAPPPPNQPPNQPPNPRPNQPPNQPPPGGAPHGAVGLPAGPPKRSVSTGQILGGILLVLVVIFIFENTDDVKVRLIFPQYTMPVALPIIIAAVLGALIAWLLRYRRQRNHPSGSKRARKHGGSVS